MPKAPTLTDMLLQRNDATDRVQAASRNKGPARAAHKQAARTEFIPEQQAPPTRETPAREARTAAPKPFHERVKESQARMSRKDHAFFNQHARQADQARNDQAARSQDAAASQRAAADARTGKVSDRKEAPKARETASGWAPKESRPMELENASAPASRETAVEDGWDGARDPAEGMDYDALQARLEELGIAASPEQLRDPAFLAEMLWMIDGLPAAILPFEATPAEGEAPVAGLPAGPAAAVASGPADPDAASAAPPLEAGTARTGEAAVPGTRTPAMAADPAVADRNALQAGPALAQALPEEAEGSGETTDWAAVAEPEREEIAALIRGKLGMLADKPEFRGGPDADRRAAAPALPDAIQMARAGTGFHPAPASAPAADIALADPDRLRVLQAAGLAAPESRPAAAPGEPGLDRDNLPDEDGDGYEDLLPGALETDKDGADGKQSPSDLPGRNPSNPQGAAAEPFGPKDGPALKDAPSAHFQAAVDLARGPDARASEAKAPPPHQPTSLEQTVLAQIARKLSALGSRGTEEIRIQLEPEHLGKVRIALDMRDGGLTARIAVESDSVRQMVDANLASLKESLESQGIKLNGMEVSVEQRHSSLFNPDGSNAREFFQRRGQGRDGNPDAGDARDGSADAETGRRLGYNTMEFIA